MFEQRYAILREDYANAGKASSAIKSALKQLGIAPDILRRIAVACYEAEINLIIHSYGGEILMSIDEENSKVILSFNDTGPGIPDMEKALTPGFSTASATAREFGFGAGMGLPNIKRVSDEFDVVSSSEGTHLKIGFYV